MLTLAITQPGANGITAQTAMAKVTLITGASRNTNLSALAGMVISLNTNFRRSAKDCNRPNGPTTLGPLRHCTAAQTLRSNSSRKATPISRTTVTSRIWPSVSRLQKSGVVNEMPPVVIVYSAATGADFSDAARAEHSAMVTLARAIGLVW